jgi:acetoin utilization deacetylase AcuC-like enzyme
MPAESGQPNVVGYIFPTPGLLGAVEPHVPAALSARTGAWCFDTMTVVAEGTWEAARGAVDAALTAADLVLDGAPAAYACCRPPGHHVTRTAYGGSCYLNNAAVVAQYLRDSGFARVALLDVDAHHGNGAQTIFRERDDVLTASVHVDPGAGWFPHFLGFAEESDEANLNVPLAPGTGDEAWLAGVDRLVDAARAHESDVLVVALGVDAAIDDPYAPLAVTEAGYRGAGRRLGALGLPTVLVQEGGYVLETVGPLVRATLEGFESGRS